MNLTRVLFSRFMRFKDHTDPFLGKRLDLGLDKFWKRRKILMATAHYRGRRRNCITVAHRAFIKAMEYVNASGELRRKSHKDLCDVRVEAGSYGLNYDGYNMRDTLSRLNVGLNRKVMANLAVTEPRSFRSIVGLCAYKEAQPESLGGRGTKPGLGPPVTVLDPHNRF